MFCPKCGMNLEDDAKVCSNCGLDMEAIKQQSMIDVNSSMGGQPITPSLNQLTIATEQNKSQNIFIRILFFTLAAVVFIMFFMAASTISKGGLEIMQIQSVGGQTLEEAYYSALGNIYSGYAMIARALGIFFASALIWLGLKK